MLLQRPNFVTKPGSRKWCYCSPNCRALLSKVYPALVYFPAILQYRRWRTPTVSTISLDNLAIFDDHQFILKRLFVPIQRQSYPFFCLFNIFHWTSPPIVSLSFFFDSSATRLRDTRNLIPVSKVALFLQKKRWTDKKANLSVRRSISIENCVVC